MQMIRRFAQAFERTLKKGIKSQLFLKKRVVLKSLQGMMASANDISLTRHDAGFAYVRNVENGDKLQVTFSFAARSDTKARLYTIDREKDEAVEKALIRISANVSKHVIKRKKQKTAEATAENSSATADPEVEASFEDASGNSLSPEAKNVEAWVPGNTLVISFLRRSVYRMVLNPPTVVQLDLTASIMADFPLYPRFALEFSCRDQSRFEWFSVPHQLYPKGRPPPSDQLDSETVAKITDRLLHTGPKYTPGNDVIESYLLVRCTPVSEGGEEGLARSVMSKCVVSAGPGASLADSRLAFTAARAGQDSFRVVTYNILADVYANSDYSATVLHPQCPPYALALDYRKQLLFKEIIGYNADVLCLQEVDRKLFERDLQPVLSGLGYGSHVVYKASGVHEGSAVFFARDKFRLLEQQSVVLRKFILEDAANADLAGSLDSNPDMKEVMRNRHTILNLCVLESVDRPDHVTCVMTTHLFFAPNANIIRLLQVIAAVRILEETKEKLTKQGKTVSTVLCGDFNSTPGNGVLHYVTTGGVTSDYKDWSMEGPAPKGGHYRGCAGIATSHSFNFASAYGTPEYTNYTHGFVGCLDYLFFDADALEVKEVIPFPPHEDIVAYEALPNIVYPSDHLALVCDLSWRN